MRRKPDAEIVWGRDRGSLWDKGACQPFPSRQVLQNDGEVSHPASPHTEGRGHTQRNIVIIVTLSIFTGWRVKTYSLWPWGFENLYMVVYVSKWRFPIIIVANINIVLIKCRTLFLALPCMKTFSLHNASITGIRELRHREVN